MRHLLWLALGCALLAPSTVDGSVTIGSNLARAPTEEVDCGESSCTQVQQTLPATSASPRGVISPVNGVVSVWRIRAGALTTVTAFRVIRSAGTDFFTGAGTTDSLMPIPNAVTTVLDNVGIAVGDRIGLDVAGAPVNYSIAGGGTADRFQPVLADGGLGRAPNSTGSREFAFNADIVPTSAFRAPEKKSLRHGRISVTIQAPNPGTVAATDVWARSLAAVKAGKSPLLRPGSAQVSAPGPVTLILKPTKTARARLQHRRKLRSEVKVSFTATGGGSSVQVIDVRPRR